MSGTEPGEPRGAAVGRLAETVRRSGLIDPASSGIILLSGGPDSVALLAGLEAHLGRDSLVALHLNYGLRQEAGDDQDVCADVCRRLGVELVVIEAGNPGGNVQAWARELRYSAADELRIERGADWVAVGHTRTDAAETVMYRLATSPGRRAVAAMKERSGTVVRPLLGLNRSEVRQLAGAAGLRFAVDASNRDPAFARVRIRTEVMPVLEEINPAAEKNIMRTRSELLEEGELLDQLAADLVEAASMEDGSLSAKTLGGAHPALARLALRQMAEDRLGHQVPVSPETSRSVIRLALDPEGGSVDIGGGERFEIESGRVKVSRGEEIVPASEPVTLDLPGETTWNGWRINAAPLEAPFAPAETGSAALDLDATGERVTVRGWLPGDRIQPLGMDGTKTLQDLFTDKGIERSRRRQIPVLLHGDQVVWVAGVATGHRFRLTEKTGRAVVVRAHRDRP